MSESIAAREHVGASSDVADDVPATASTAPAPLRTTPLEPISVTGIRRANENAIDTKRASIHIIDAVSATDVRALPDPTIVDALRRVPGVSVLPATDNEHPRDEAAVPVIRGLGPSYNNVTLDGLTVASPGIPNGNLGSVTRGVRLDILPSSMVSELQVVKTFTPDLDPNATGGAINLKTRSAFAEGGRPFFSMEAGLGHASDSPDVQDHVGKRGTATGSWTFGDAHQYGITLSGNYQKLSSFTQTHMTTDTIHESFYNDAGQLLSGTNTGNGYAVPQQDKYWYVTDQRTRYGLTGKFEAKLGDNLQAFVTAGYYRFKDDMVRNEDLIDPRNRNQVYNQTATSGSYPAADMEIGYSHQAITTRTKILQTGVDWQVDDRQTLGLRAAWSDATYDEPIQMVKYTTGVTRPAPVPVGTNGPGIGVTPTPNFGFAYDTSRFNQRFNISPAAYYDLSNYTLSYWRPDYKRTAADRILSGRLDYSFNRAPGDTGWGLGAGVAATSDKPRYNVYRDDFEANTNAPTLSLADVAMPTGKKLKYLGLDLLAIDSRKAFAELASVPRTDFNSTDQSGFSNQDNFTHREDIYGAYADVSYRTADWSLLAGVRYDDTHQSTTGQQQQLSPGTGKYGWVSVTTRSSYDHALPSALFTYHLTDSLDLRAAASRTLGRPPYDAYAARTSISFANASDLGNPQAQGITVNIGNPAIKPRLSTNFDLALDWQLPGDFDGLLSAALFHKRIEDEIFTLSGVGSFTYNGTPYANVLTSMPTNASRARLRGLELSGVLNSLAPLAPWLSHFGVSANYSRLQGQLTVPYSTGSATSLSQLTRTVDHLVGQPTYTANASVFYTIQRLELRAAVNRQGTGLRAVVSNIAWQDLYWASRTQVDLSATYAITREISIVGQVGNVTRAPVVSKVGPQQDLLKDSFSVPRIYWLAVRYTPAL